ncbi:MAG: radical SAM protein [Deltaproteobacteria bacterium]|nr:radical SAM protein [Deltaproteobacteria bacterium]
MTPSYVETHRRGELADRAARAAELLRECRLCPRACGVDRSAGELGHCQVGPGAEVASAGPHFGEERPLVGRGGSGTIFLASCNLRCVFCQNYDISQELRGVPASPTELARMMIGLQEMGCHNINFVTPSHQVPAILAALGPAIEAGLRVPLVYNSSGYDSIETLALLRGVFDIYMPDLKTLDPRCAELYLRAADYPEAAKGAVREMHRQVGDLVLDDRAVATRGILLRHLVMPADLAATREALRFVRDEISPQTYVNLMAQWHPAGEAHRFPEIDRPLRRGEYERAVETAAAEGICRLDERPAKLMLVWR